MLEEKSIFLFYCLHIPGHIGIVFNRELASDGRRRRLVTNSPLTSFITSYVIIMSVCMSVWTITFECLDLETSYLVWWDILTIFRSSLC